MKHRPEGLRLKEALQRQSREQTLSAEQLRALRSLSATAPADLMRRRWLGAAAAGVVVGALGWQFRPQVSPEANRQRLADEIAYNHLQPKPLDVRGSSLDALRPAFEPLGFRLADDPRLALVQGQLVGGRYCSVASVPAALLRYEHARGHCTVYQALFDAERHIGVQAHPAPDFDLCQARGVRVCLWRCEDLLFAFATT